MTPHEHAAPPDVCPYCAISPLPIPNDLTEEDMRLVAAIAKAYWTEMRQSSSPPTTVLVRRNAFSRLLFTLFGLLEVVYSDAIEPGSAVLVRGSVAVTV